MNKKTLKDVDVNNKKVLVRVDFNVPIKDGKITDDNRINVSLPTINYLIENNAKIILFSHLGRVKTDEDKKNKSLKVVAESLSKKLKKKVIFIAETRGKILEDAINNLNPKDVLLFENTRFEDIDNNKESKNDPELGKYWASLGEVFVNEAFGTVHRAHASNVGIAKNIKVSCLGFLVEKEISMLSQAINNPAKPFVAIIGGAKVSDKIGIIENLLKKADQILIGGGMAFTFFAAQGYKIGNSLVENDKIALAKKLLTNSKGKLILPTDFAISKEFKNNKPEFTEGIDVPDGYMGLDIGPKTIQLFSNILENAKTVVWNGPMGVFEMSHYAKGTIAVCVAISKLNNSFTIIGGGDSAAAAIQLGYEDKFTHISSGGGSSLEFMEGKKLPGIECIQNK